MERSFEILAIHCRTMMRFQLLAAKYATPGASETPFVTQGRPFVPKSTTGMADAWGRIKPRLPTILEIALMFQDYLLIPATVESHADASSMPHIPRAAMMTP